MVPGKGRARHVIGHGSDGKENPMTHYIAVVGKDPDDSAYGSHGFRMSRDAIPRQTVRRTSLQWRGEALYGAP